MQDTYLTHFVVLTQTRPCRSGCGSGGRSKLIKTLKQGTGGAVPGVEARSRKGATGQIVSLPRVDDDGIQGTGDRIDILGVEEDTRVTNNLDFVFDRSGMSLNGVPILMYAKDNVDFTTDVITVLNKPGRAGAEKPATAPASSPAKAATSPKP